MSATAYTLEILRLATMVAPATLDAPAQSGEAVSRTCGSRIAADVRLDGEGRIAALAFRPHACAFGQAATALAAELAPGQDRTRLAATRAALAAWLAAGHGDAPDPRLAPLAPALAHPGRHGAVLLPWDALLAALDPARAAA